MLEAVEREAWVHVVDCADRFPDILNVSSTAWLEMLPHHERSLLAVVVQNEHAAQARYDSQVGIYGIESRQAQQAAEKFSQVEKTTEAVLVAVTNTVTSMLATACVDPSDTPRVE